MENIDQGQPVDDSDIQARMASLLEAEEANLEGQEIAQEAEQEIEAADQESEGEEQAPEDEVLEITWNEEKKALKKSEVIELAQKGYDYTAKTQQLAEQRKTLEAQQQQFQQQAQIQVQLADKVAVIKSIDNQLAAYKQVNWQELAQSDPMQYLTTNQSYQQLKDARNEALAEYQAESNKLTDAQIQYRNNLVQRESKLLEEAVPAFRGEGSAKARADLASHLRTIGFSEEEVESLVDHRLAKMAWESMQYAKLQSTKPQITKKMAEAPKIVKGKAPNAPNQQIKELQARAKKGDERAIQLLIEKSL